MPPRIHTSCAFKIFHAITLGSTVTCTSSAAYLESWKKGSVNSPKSHFPNKDGFKWKLSHPMNHKPRGATGRDLGLNRGLCSVFHLESVSAFMLAHCKQGAKERKTYQSTFKCYLQHTKMDAASLERAKNRQCLPEEWLNAPYCSPTKILKDKGNTSMLKGQERLSKM